MFLVFFVFTTIFFLSLIFNIYLFFVIFAQPDKNKLPTVYIYNMILSSSVDIVIMFLTFLMPMAMDDGPYYEFRRSIGQFLTINCTFFYEHPLYLTLLMIIQRIYAVFRPFNRHFTNEKLWLYCGIMAIFSWISLLIPYFSDCPVNIDQRRYTFAVDCAERHPITLFQNRYLIVLPFTTMLLNISLIFYLTLQKRLVLSSSVGNSTTSVTVNRPIFQRSKQRKSFEKMLLFQSVSTTAFLLLYEVSSFFIRNFSKEYSQLSEDLRMWIFYIRLTPTALFCFLIYYIGTPSIRRLLIERTKLLYKGSYEATTVIQM
ncbi:Protein CBR-SRXA-14 [Caenorhabditis briggsae]|uniref:Protein CBR-SRXA-14 n=2 Tax=Caenorhabditis briggsae TaxID=6238 RepID=A8X0B9_CAEBR|nr:Protein CBR-SRXA-14 [Caenorhabditis briggsae]ULT92790.1 hypothetical protein L3Y34_010110 [Caenorhabditis briggsae]CAP26079.2 Protein CBR-SRXA-14 [Caenorhabditis briggsae]